MMRAWPSVSYCTQPCPRFILRPVRRVFLLSPLSTHCLETCPHGRHRVSFCSLYLCVMHAILHHDACLTTTRNFQELLLITPKHELVSRYKKRQVFFLSGFFYLMSMLMSPLLTERMAFDEYTSS